MTRSVWAGRPWGRGLAWGAAVLLGVAALLGTSDRSDVAAKDEPAAKKGLPPDLALIPGDAFAFVTIRVADLWKDEATKGLRTDLARERPDEYKAIVGSVAVEPAEIERLTFVITKTPGPNDPNPEVAVLVSTIKPYDSKKVLGELLPEGKTEKRNGKEFVVQGPAALYPVDARHFLMGGTETVYGVVDKAGKGGNNALAAAVVLAAGKHPVVGAIRPAALLETIGNMIPPEVETFKPLLEVPVAYGHVELGKETKAEAHLVCAAESDTKDVTTAAKGLVALIQTFLPMGETQLDKMPKGKVDTFKKLYKEFGNSLKNLPIEAKGKEVRVALTLKADTATLSKAVLEGLTIAEDGARRISSVNNLKQMALAMHNVASAEGHLPAAAICDKDGKPLLSWRVAILPYIEQDALYKEFRLDEPWDSDHNKKLIDKMPNLYRVPPQDGKEAPAKETKTHYRVFHGKGAAFEGTTGVKFSDITDGTSNTILIVEAEEAVVWTKPEELPFDVKKDPPKVGLKGMDSFNAAAADGAVHTISKTIDKDTLKGLITRNGGEMVNFP
ncbi:MAG TPA: DUF1559 domain-containing protein [Gemmataceae bacterium]|nr:DUF1559 domain-containing protein [Gemmataceae bacterium]